MAKQRRAGARAVRSKPVASVPSAGLLGSAGIPAERGVSAPPPPPRPGHLEAVALYEEGIAALQGHDFARASSILRSVIARFPDERELHERVRLYLNVCERHMTPRAQSPSTPEERIFAATLAVNAGNYDEAIDHLRTATAESPEHDHALYMLASVLVLRDQVEGAVPLLLRSIELNPDNRALARHDPDLEPLRQYDSVRAALEASSPAKLDKKKGSRRRP